ncbi:ATP-binding cassette domain-containing protein [Alphaproteobacteria bacterium LSUCC0684]
MNALIAAENLTVYRDRRPLLDRVSIEVVPSDFLTIIGPNGAGKTTLLRCLAGVMKPDDGVIRRRAGLRTSYIPQRMTAEASLPMDVKSFLKLNTRSSQHDLDEVATETDINSLMNRSIHVLSGGEWQRVLLARSLINRPDLIILDEPAQNLDLSGQLAFYEHLNRVHRERNIALVMVSHDLHMVMASTRKVVCLYHHVCCSGEPTAVTRDPEFIQLFGKDMARMMAVYQHDHDHHHDHDHPAAQDQ